MRKDVIEAYKKYGIDVYEALRKLKNATISLHCWQLDDVGGFENAGDLTGGIQSTGNYPYKARNFAELTKDLDESLKYIPGNNNSETISFKYYSSKSKYMYQSSSTKPFAIDGVIGTIDNPEKIGMNIVTKK